MVTLGIHAFTHDSTAALAVDGRLVAFAHEERLSRIKNDGSFPERAIRFVLDDAGLDPRDVECVVTPFRPWVGALTRLAYRARRAPHNWRTAADLIGKGGRNLNLGRRLGALDIDAPIVRTDHHAAHARAVFQCSPFDEAAVLVIDGVAEAWSGASFVVRREGHPRLECLQRIRFPASLGLLYAAVTEHLGFRHNQEEGKVMSMAAFGSADLVPEMRRLCRLDGGWLHMDQSCFDFGGNWTSARFARIFGPKRTAGETIQQHHFDLAKATQEIVEDIAVDLARNLLSRSGVEKLCLTGGLALNPAVNEAVLRRSGADTCYFLPVGGDAGAPIGAVLEHGPDPGWRLEHAYWGNQFTNRDVDQALEHAGLSPTVTGNGVVGRVARLLDEGHIGGWFRGRSEMGPRALGHRSILADPRRTESRMRLNQSIKLREDFQPFAPAAIVERCRNLFPQIDDSPFMLRTTPVGGEARQRIPAVLHRDGTTRVQTVRGDDASGLAPVLSAFEDLSGIPVLLNTSMNRRGEPLVESPDEAIAVFRETGLDFLVLEDRLLERIRG